MDWDVFISHAWEDKEDVARPLAEALGRKGLRVWYDEFTLTLGDSLRRSIDHGLTQSRYGVVILSPYFFKKEWPKRELDGLVAKEVSSGKTILPVWHSVTWEDVTRFSPTLADKLAVSTARGLDAVVEEILRALQQAAPSTVIERVQPFEPEMILIPAGDFLMGSDPSVDKYAWDDEQPQHTLYMPDYYLARTPVTNAQYAAFVQATGYKQPEHWQGEKPPRGKEDHPVVYVSWHDAMTYCNWLADVTSKPYRLPSEAEWEKGARGSDGRIYPWGNRWDAKRCHTDARGTTPVGAYPEGASPYGLLDMAGNVWEWTRSLYKRYLYDPDDGREDLEAKGSRVLRGGSWLDLIERLARCSCRSNAPPSFLASTLGCALLWGSLAFSPDSGVLNSGFRFLRRERNERPLIRVKRGRRWRLRVSGDSKIVRSEGSP